MPFGATAAVSVAGWLASPLFSKLLDHRILHWKDKKELEEGLEKEIESLRDVLPKIKSITEDAEEKQFKDPGVRDWLRKLKDLLYNAEDVLDMYEVDLLLKKQRDTELSSKKKVSFPPSIFCSSEKSKDGAQSSNSISVAKEIKLIRKRLDESLQQGKDFGLKDTVRSTPLVDPGLFQKRETTSFLEDDESAFVGRDGVKKKMIKQLVPGKKMKIRSSRTSSITGGHGGYWLWTNLTRLLHLLYWLLLSFIHLFLRGTRNPSDDGRKFLVLPIVGMGGLGKTTLAQLVFNDKKVVAFYKTRAWVCVGQSHDLDPSQTTAKIVESVRSLQGNKEACNFSTLQALQTTLVDEIKDPFLLVVDDAWDVDSNGWDKLLGPLKASKKRCRVIVTTRNRKVADAFHDSLRVMRLGFLNNKSMWSIFEKSAFGNKHSRDFPELRTIGRLIVRKLKGLPLAAKTIGGILYGNRNERDWRRILDSEHMLNNNNQEEDFMRSILMLSYYSLPVILKQYFLCFSLFPKDYEFCQYSDYLHRDRYMHRNRYNDGVWMIERVLFLVETGISLEYNCFNGLLNRSLLLSRKYHFDITISMHDLIHDMTEFIGKEEFLRISDASTPRMTSKSETIRHISFFQKWFDPNLAFLKDLHTSYKSLRTILYNNRNERLNNSEVLHSWFTNLRYLRVLSLHNYYITILPDSIGNLKLLCYLDLFLPKIRELPETISHLYKLQGLNLFGCNNLRELPRSVTRLVNLIHLDVEPKLLNKVDGIGKLTNLQELEEFHIKEEEGHTIAELENMNDLCGSLSIYNLDIVKDEENAQQARLNQKMNLESLKLYWSIIGHGDEWQTNMVEGLRPHTTLGQLSIERYRGTHLPNWLTSPSFISLHRLHVSRCHYLIEIPSLPSMLRYLSLSDNHGLESLFSSSPTVCMPSLQKLEIRCCDKLNESLNVLLKASLVSLEYLDIKKYNCPLEGLSCVTTLRELKLDECKGKVILNRTALISLREIRIRHCQDVVVQGHCSDPKIYSSLTILSIIGSPMLLESMSHWRVLLTSLSNLYISFSECDDWTLSQCLCNATALEELRLQSCSNITSLPSELMHKLAATKKLIIRGCRKLMELEFPPVANIGIFIRDCPNLSFRRSSRLLNTYIKRLSINGFSGEQLSGFFSISQNTPIQSIALRSCIITDDTATSMLRGVSDNATLEELMIEDCGGFSREFSSLESLRKLNICRCSAITSLPVLSSLVELWIDNCRNLTFTCGGASTPLFPSLEILHAYRFSTQQLTDLTKGLIKSPIRHITIAFCDELESFDGDLLYAMLALKNSLERLSIGCCRKLRGLPTHFEVFEALRELRIWSCRQMSTLPDGLPPTSLQTLRVTHCPALKALYKEGNQWLSNIPYASF